MRRRPRILRACRWLGLPIVVAAVAACPVASEGSAASAPLTFANPSWSPDGTQLAFAYADASRYRIATVPATGGGGVRTVYTGKTIASCCDPLRWAASGRILFVANFALRSLHPGSGPPARLFAGTPNFILSPNRRTAAFDDGCDCEDSRDAIGLVRVTGGKPFVIPKPTNAADVIDSFSPDGAELVFTRLTFASATSQRPVATLLAEHVGGGVPLPLGKSGLIGTSHVPAGAEQVQWSPNSRWIAFVVRNKLELVSTAGGPARIVERRPFSAFSWSPSSTALAYGLNNGHIATVDLRGHHALLWYTPSLHAFSESSLDPPQWSPDRTRLVFMSSNSPRSALPEIWIVGAEGQAPSRIA